VEERLIAGLMRLTPGQVEGVAEEIERLAKIDQRETLRSEELPPGVPVKAASNSLQENQ